MSVRKVFFWMHLAAGCIGGIVILLMSITGVLLMYERQILARVERAPFRVAPPSPGAPRMPVEDLLQKVAGETGGFAPGTMLTVRAEPHEPSEISAGREGALYVDPYTGRVLGRPEGSWRRFFRSVTSWHRWIAMEGEGRAVGKAITGACNLAFLGLVMSGVYLWLPKKWTRKQLAPIVWFRGGASGKARDFNWHNVFGLWCSVPLFVVVLTAVPMSYTWANDLIFRLTGSEPSRLGPPGMGPGGRRREPPSTGAKLNVAGLNRLWEVAAAQQPGWRSIAMRLPESPRRPVSFIVDTGDGGQPQKRATVSLDRATGAVTGVESLASQSTGRRIRSWARFLHTGEALGIGGQTAAGVASAGGVMLLWTGVALSLRRLSAWRKRKRSRSTAGVDLPESAVEQPAGRAEQKGQREARHDQQVGNPALAGIVNYPGANQQVEGEVMHPSRQHQPRIGKQRADALEG
jgi:uncharacterized iron-regulated membrane protein